jgi:hypothetical protein
MSRFPFLSLLAAATAASFVGTASASESARVAPSAPSFVRELPRTGAATVGGTVVRIHSGHDVLLADAEGGTVRVDIEDLSLAGLAAGEMITVTGRLDEGELEAAHAIREDGSVETRGSDDGAR